MGLKLREGWRKEEEEEEEGGCNLYKKRPLGHISLSHTPPYTDSLSPFLALSLSLSLSTPKFLNIFFVQKKVLRSANKK